MKFHFRHQNTTTVLLLLCIGLSSICSCTEKPDDEVKLPDNLNKKIEFADRLMEEACIRLYDENQDGELSYAEAGLVKDLTLMKDVINPKITSFDEFKYFTNVKEISQETFSGTSLSKITLPNNLIAIRKSAFKGCKLTTISIPENVVTIEAEAFRDCAELTSVSLPKNVKSLLGTFRGCSNLETIELPESVTELKGTFRDCSNLKTIVLPENVSVIGSYTFYECSNLKSITLPESVTSGKALCA